LWGSVSPRFDSELDSKRARPPKNYWPHGHINFDTIPPKLDSAFNSGRFAAWWPGTIEGGQLVGDIIHVSDLNETYDTNDEPLFE
jgi:hypothetical protein